MQKLRQEPSDSSITPSPRPDGEMREQSPGLGPLSPALGTATGHKLFVPGRVQAQLTAPASLTGATAHDTQGTRVLLPWAFIESKQAKKSHYDKKRRKRETEHISKDVLCPAPSPW